jgi:SM-20-related protein
MKSKWDQFEQITTDLAERGYAVFDDFLSASEARDILSSTEFKSPQNEFSKAGIGAQKNRQVHAEIRGDYIQWIDPARASPAIGQYLNIVKGLMEHINRGLFLSLKDCELHLTIYPVGTFYQRHLDQFRRDDHRKLSLIFYLNENWKDEEGGQLRIYLPEGPVDIVPKAGRLVCFRSDQIEHEVLPATRDRLSITGWLLDQIADLRHL